MAAAAVLAVRTAAVLAVPPCGPALVIVAVVLAPLLSLCCCCCCVALALRALSRASPGLLRGWVRPARSQRHAPSLATTVFTAGA